MQEPEAAAREILHPTQQEGEAAAHITATNLPSEPNQSAAVEAAATKEVPAAEETDRASEVIPKKFEMQA